MDRGLGKGGRSGTRLVGARMEGRVRYKVGRGPRWDSGSGRLVGGPRREGSWVLSSGSRISQRRGYQPSMWEY